LAPLGLWLTLDAGTFNCVRFDFTKDKVRIGFAPATQFTSKARLRIEVPAKMAGISGYFPARSLPIERNAYIVPLSLSTTWIDLIAKRRP